MKFIIIVAWLLVVSSSLYANDREKLSPEQLYVDGTELLKPEKSGYNPKLGLELLLESANAKYEFAPFGLCAALSTTPEIMNLKEAYSWCYVAEKIGDKYSNLATIQGSKILHQLETNEGPEAVSLAKAMGISRYSR